MGLLVALVIVAPAVLLAMWGALSASANQAREEERQAPQTSTPTAAPGSASAPVSAG